MRVIAILMLAVMVSCTSFDQEVTYKVDPLLQSDVDRFYLEAESRGITIYKDNLIVCFMDSMEPDGNSSMIGDQRVIKIKRDTYDFYMSRGEKEVIEFLVFHEMGHAVLLRDHADNINSIMSQGLSKHAYEGDAKKRGELLDELFTN